MDMPNEKQASNIQPTPVVETHKSRGVLGWIRQNSIRRFRSRDASRTPRDTKGNGVAQKVARTDSLRDEACRGSLSHSAKLEFFSRAESVKGEDDQNYHPSGLIRRSKTLQSISGTEVGSEQGYEFNEEDIRRTTRSEPGDLSDRSVGFSDLHKQKKKADSSGKSRFREEREGTGKTKPASSSSGLARIGSFFTRSFSRSRSRHLKDSPAAAIDDKNGEDALHESVLVSNGSNASSSPRAPSLPCLDHLEPPDFSADAWLQKFGQQEETSTTVLAACRTATEKVIGCLTEVENSIKLILENSEQRNQQICGSEKAAEDANKEKEHYLAPVRRFMDSTEESTLHQIRYQEDELLLYELLQISETFKKLLYGVGHAAKLSDALRHDLKGEEEQLHAWQREYGYLKESKNYLEDLYKRICETRNGLLQRYHDECIRLNQSIQLLSDKIANTVADVFAEFEQPPSLDTLYGRAEFPSASRYKCNANELRSTKGNSRAYQQMVAGHLPPFILRLKLYAFNPPESSRPTAKPKVNSSPLNAPKHSLIGPSDASSTAHLFSPLRLDDCLPRQSCIRSVPPGLALMSSEPEIERYEAQLWDVETNGRASEGGWGSFRVFEQWLVDSMKWQWRDAFMYSKLRERQKYVRAMIAAKKADIDDAVRLRLTQLWWGRLVEMQAYHSDQAEKLFMHELGNTDSRVHYAKSEAAQGYEKLRVSTRERGSPGLQKRALETENALMLAEDMRSYVLRTVENPAFTVFTDCLRALVGTSSDTEAQVKFLKGQIERANGLVRRYDDANEASDGYEVLQRECNQLEAALALLDEELKALESRRSVRHSQLASKRKKLTEALEKLGAAFDVDNKKLAEIEAQWNSAGKVEELVQAFLSTTDDINDSKFRLSQNRKELEAQQNQLQAEWQRLEEERQALEKNKQLSKVASPRGSKKDTTRAGLSSAFLEDAPGKTSVPPSPRTSHRRSDSAGQPVSPSHSKSFMGRIFRGPLGVSTPRQSKAAQEGTVSDNEGSNKQASTRRQSVASEPSPPGDDLLPLMDGKSSAIYGAEELTAHDKCSVSHGPSLSSQVMTQPMRHDLPLLAHAHSSPPVLNFQLEGEQVPLAYSPVGKASSSLEQHGLDQRAGTEVSPIEAGGDGVSVRKKSKNAVPPLSRKSQRKKKSMYGKLRSALSLTQLPLKEKKRAASPQEDSIIKIEHSSEQHVLLESNAAVPKQGSKEDGWSAVGRQSSVLAAIPNIFDSAEDEGGEATVSKDTACAKGPTNAYVVDNSDSSDSAAEVPTAPDIRSAMPAAFSTAHTTMFMGAASDPAAPQQSFAEAFHRSYNGRTNISHARNGRPSSEQSVTPDPLGHVPQFGSNELNCEQPTDTVPRENLTQGVGSPAAEEEEMTSPETVPIIAFPSESAGSPADFNLYIERQSVPLVDLQEEEAEDNAPRRRSDLGSSAKHKQSILRPYGASPSRIAVAFDRGAAEWPVRSSSSYVDEDDRIELFVVNGQADIASAVISSCVFSLLDAAERQHCISLMQNSFVQIPKGCMLIQRGDKVDNLYFLVSGVLGMTVPNAAEPNMEARELELPRITCRRRSSYDTEVPQEQYPIELAPGSFVTPRAFVREEQTNHSIMALRPCTLQKLSYHSFQHVLSACIFRRAPQVMGYLGACPILESLTRKERVQIAALLKWKIYLPEEVICYQGEVCNSLFLVVNGNARAFRYVERQGNPDVVDEFSAGDSINALALLHDAPSDVTIRAAAPDGCVLALLERQELQDTLGDAETILNRLDILPFFFTRRLGIGLLHDEAQLPIA